MPIEARDLAAAAREFQGTLNSVLNRTVSQMRLVATATVEVPIDTDTGVHQPCVVNCDGLHTVAQQQLTQRLGSLDDDILEEICEAAAVALGCDRA